jgi:hypothetical protein
MIQRPKEKDQMIKGQKKRTDDAKVKIKGQLPLHHLVLFI